MENIFKRLDFVIKESENVTKHFDKKELEEVTMFCMCMLDRVNFSSESLRILMKQFLNNTKVEYSCGIILRSVLLDYLILLNAMEIFSKNLSDEKKLYSEMKDYCLMMLCDSVRNTMEYFETLEDEIPKEILAKMYNHLVSTNGACFETYAFDGSKPTIRIKNYKSPKQLFNTLVASKDFSKQKSVYEAYLYYSKYDHFGNMFYGLSRLPVIDQLSNIDKAVKVFPKVLLFTLTILEVLYSKDIFLKDKRQTVMSFIDTMEDDKKK